MGDVERYIPNGPSADEYLEDKSGTWYLKCPFPEGGGSVENPLVAVVSLLQLDARACCGRTDIVQSQHGNSEKEQC